MSGTLKIVVAVVTMFLISATQSIAAGENGMTRKIGDGVYSFTLRGGNYYMFVVGKDSVAVIETFSSGHSRKLLAAIRSVTDKPVAYAFHTHNHWDHTSGGQVFKAAGAQTVMHTLAAKWLAANPGRDAVAPDMVWSGNRKDFDFGDFTVQLHYLGLNHGLGMSVVTIPERRAAYIADLVTPNRIMFAVVPDFNIGQWERTLGEILEMKFDIAVCSHNALPVNVALNGCTRGHVQEERQYIRDLRNAVLAELKKGTSFDQIPEAVKLPKYKNWVGYNDWLKMNTLRMMTDLWMGPFPWVPDAN